MRQETVRRLLNTSIALPQASKDKILSDFAVKLTNSGYTKKQIKGILVEGIVKFEHLRWKDLLPKDHIQYSPLHLDASFNRHSRKLKKFLAEENWFQPNGTRDNSWRHKVPANFKLETKKVARRSRHQPTTVLKVPSTKNGVLINSLIKNEFNLSQYSGYAVKYVEQSGTPLNLLFRMDPKSKSCERIDCMVCKFSDKKGGNKCRTKNIVQRHHIAT